MEGRVESNSDERSRPYAVGGIHEETSADSSHSIADEVGGESDENLVGEMSSIGLVEVLGEILDPDDVVCVGCIVCNIGHDGD